MKSSKRLISEDHDPNVESKFVPSSKKLMTIKRNTTLLVLSIVVVCLSLFYFFEGIAKYIRMEIPYTAATWCSIFPLVAGIFGIIAAKKKHVSPTLIKLLMSFSIIGTVAMVMMVRFQALIMIMPYLQERINLGLELFGFIAALIATVLLIWMSI